MTQKEHAALASVSAPTIIAFDRGELTLSLAKAMDILRVVGLVEEISGENAQEVFVRDAFARWRKLTNALPPASPGRFSHGWYRVDYALDGDLKDIDLHRLPDLLRQATVRPISSSHTGLRMFWLPGSPELEARAIDGVIECWLKPGDLPGFDRPFYDAADCDFWRVAPSGRLFLIRGYQEDTQETFAPGTLFDTIQPIWRIGEAFLHAARSAKLLARDPQTTTIRMRILYTGLLGRDLRSWASPLGHDYFGGGRSRSDEAMLEGIAPAGEIEAALDRFVYPLVTSLFERFGVTGITSEFIASELARMRSNDFH
jgi:transcriptional regulator with XRE-family HTH domain